MEFGEALLPTDSFICLLSQFTSDGRKLVSFVDHLNQDIPGSSLSLVILLKEKQVLFNIVSKKKIFGMWGGRDLTIHNTKLCRDGWLPEAQSPEPPPPP